MKLYPAVLRFIFTSFLLTLSLHSFSTSLPPEHEVARLMLAIESSVQEKNWSKAKSQLESMSLLNAEQPTNSYYFNGFVHFQLKQYFIAQEFLEHYVVKAGLKGEYYIESLRLITQVEDISQEPVIDMDRDESKFKPEIVSSSRNYVKSLKELFLTDDPIQALQFQLNSLLSSSPYTGSRLKKNDLNEGVKYQLSVESGQIQLQETRYDKGLPMLSVSTVDVSGIDPFVRYECSIKTYGCWVVYPSNNYQRWFIVDHVESVASELSMALTKLIQILQKAP